MRKGIEKCILELVRFSQRLCPFHRRPLGAGAIEKLGGDEARYEKRNQDDPVEGVPKEQGVVRRKEEPVEYDERRDSDCHAENAATGCAGRKDDKEEKQRDVCLVEIIPERKQDCGGRREAGERQTPRQAAGANPLVRTMRENGGTELVRVTPETRATAIRIGNPASWRKAVTVLKNTGGTCEEVSEKEIAQAKAELGAEGIGCEPASAATLAGLKKLAAAGSVKSTETVVLVLTGHMLKDVDYMKQLPGQNLLGPMEADGDAVIRTLEQIYARH